MNDVVVKRPLLRLLGALCTVDDCLEGALEPLGLSLAKLGALSKLAEAQGPLPLSTLAEQLSCVRSNITQLVDRLEADRLVTREHDPRDRRSVRASLTPEGREKYVAGAAALAEVEERLLGRLPDGEREQLFRLLGRVTGE
jgi:DNA-binding MarR family transcriptional regulator